jgi:hypothetical protein
MLLQTRLDAETDLFIDCETSGGFDKDQTALDFHPDDATDHVVTIAKGVVARLKDVAEAAGGDAQVEVTFSIKVDSNAVVAVARQPDAGQFRVTVRYR